MATESALSPGTENDPAAAPRDQGALPEPASSPSPDGASRDDPSPDGDAPPAAVPPPASGGVDQDTLAWAREAYARLKAQQEAARSQTEAPQVEAQASEVPEPARRPAPEPTAVPEPSNAELAPRPSLLELAAAQRAERQQALTAPTEEPPPEAAEPAAGPAPAPAASAAPPADAAEPQLGAFDDTFTWSVEVLAAQGRAADEVSLEEIDWLGRLRQGLEKTRRGFVSQLLETLGDDPLTPELLEDLETTLLRADVGVSATDQVLEALRQRLNQEVVDPAEGIRFLKEQLRGILERPIQESDRPLLVPERDRLNVWLMVGVNGVGKTTTLGKLANLAVRSGYSCLIAAADTFRAAAVEQVRVWGDRSHVPVIANPSANADPAAVVYDAIGAARAQGTELVLVDTAGRLQTKHNLMEELAKVRRIVDKLAPEAAVESLLVLDASQGQNGLRQAMAFASAAGLTGVVLTKLDGSARGGVALAVASEAGLPIRFIGAGEGIRDLRPFNSFEFVEALLSG
ncbi:signal recognition particle-docking protein FtsY [Aphanothece microscopica]|uniref:signal recognition particle-docking protein FtsY n=1 Tax=Aphanothece microscopica TaxID=1049561 RepID=UPI003CE58FBF